MQEDKVALRRLIPSDKFRLAELANNKKIWDNVRDYFPHPYTEEEAERFIEFTKQEDPVQTSGILWGGDLVGVVGLVKRSDVYRKTAEIGYWIGEPYWNRGIAPKAVSLIVDYGFNELDLLRIDAGVFEFNKASQRVLEKCGFEFEGVFKKSIIKNGQIWDEYRYGIIKKEPSNKGS